MHRAACQTTFTADKDLSLEIFRLSLLTHIQTPTCSVWGERRREGWKGRGEMGRDTHITKNATGKRLVAITTRMLPILPPTPHTVPLHLSK